MSKRIINIMVDPSDDTPASLSKALSAPDALVLGLVVKIKEKPGGDEELVGWTFVDISVLKSLALSLLPESKNKKGAILK